jgi:glycerophosphoryl diester phosphodiesterase
VANRSPAAVSLGASGHLTEESSVPLAALEPDPTPPRHSSVLNIAHRGASCSAPENTVVAVHRAADLGADVVELDVRLSRDGVPMVIHDESLARTTDARWVFPERAPWHVADFDHGELMRLDAGRWFSAAYAGEPLVTLDEALDAARVRRLAVLVELKSPRLHATCLSEVAAVIRRQLAKGDGLRVVVQSFDHGAMREFKSGLPSVPVGLLGMPSPRDFGELSEWADHINPHHLVVNAAYVDAVRQHSMRCHVWTVNRRRAMRRVLGWGVDGLITNRPLVLREELGDCLQMV